MITKYFFSIIHLKSSCKIYPHQVFRANFLKIPVSTTHTITGSIIGVGVSKGLTAVKWGVTIRLLWAWILTIPISALLGAFFYFMFSLFH